MLKYRYLLLAIISFGLSFTTNARERLMRPPGNLAGGGYLHEWIVGGTTLTANDGAERALQQDFFDKAGGEAQLNPYPGLRAKPNGVPGFTWDPLISGSDDIILKPIQGIPFNTVRYAYTTIFSPMAGQVILSVSSNAVAKIWLNGILVSANLTTRQQINGVNIPVTLKAGDNTILLKLVGRQAEVHFSVRTISNFSGVRQHEGRENHVDQLRPEIRSATRTNHDTLTIDTDTMPESEQDGSLVHVAIVAPGNHSVAESAARRGQSISFSTSHWADGPYEIRLWVGNEETPRLTGHLLWYKGDTAQALRQVMASAPTEHSDTPDALVHTLLAEYARNRFGEMLYAIPSYSQKSAYALLYEYLEMIQVKRGGVGGAHPYGMVRLAYRDEVDDSPQYCRAYLPPGYDPAKKWPVIINLHGRASSNPSYLASSGIDRHFDYTADRYRVIMLYPFGRGNTFYRGIGDADIMRCLQLAKQRFSIDEDRVYLMGYSMGGAGCWHIGSRHPELFAALAPIFGGREYKVTMDDEAQQQLTTQDIYRLERLKSCFSNAEALLTLPVFANHGTEDTLVPIGISRYGVELLQRWGYDVSYWEHPGKGHEAPLGCEDVMLEWLLSHRRTAEPHMVRVHTAELRYATAYWLRIEQRDSPREFVYAEAQLIARNTIALRTRNVLELTLTPSKQLIDYATPVYVLWNNQVLVTRIHDGMLHLLAKGYVPASRRKSAACEGPISDIYNTPFLIVQGTTSQDAEMRERCRLAAESAAERWEQEQHYRPRFKLDSEVTEDDLHNYSLLLYGGPEDNHVAKRLISSLPLRVESDAVTIDGHRFPVTDAVAQVISPNPYNASCYLCVVAATSPAGMQQVDSLRDDVDFCVADAHAIPWVAAGFFNNAWKLQESNVERARSQR